MSLKLLKELFDEYDRAYVREMEVDTEFVEVVCAVDGKDFEITHHTSLFGSNGHKIILTLKEVNE